MKTEKKSNSVSLPLWMDVAVRELAQNHKRSLSGEIEFLVEEAIRNNAEFARYLPQNGQGGFSVLFREAEKIKPPSTEVREGEFYA